MNHRVSFFVNLVNISVGVISVDMLWFFSSYFKLIGWVCIFNGDFIYSYPVVFKFEFPVIERTAAK